MPVILKQYLGESFCGLCQEMLSVSNLAVDYNMYRCKSKLWIFQLPLISITFHYLSLQLCSTLKKHTVSQKIFVKFT